MEIPALDPATSSGGYVYDVTLSWNSEGAKQPFVDTLYEALVRSGLRTFKDDDISKLDVQKAREQSMISIIILSEDFADSPTVVQELETIIECSSRSKYLVLPVFYDVNPYKRLDKMIYNEAAPSSRNKQQLGQGISDLMSFVLRKDTDINEQKIIQSFVGFIQEGLKTNKISSWGNKVCQLMDSGLSKLPINMKFPVLKELLLQDNKYLLAIPTSFFEFMPSLQVLDMSRTSIKQLPPSISNLVYLQKLFLRDCALLMKLPPEIQDLKNLEIFDLSGTELIYIPEEIKNLCKLECLRMSLSASADEYILEINENMEVNKKIEIIPKNTLSKLSNLKELSIFVDLNCKWWGVIVESIILDLGSLEKLEILKLYFPTVYLLQRLLQLQKVCQSLSDFRLVVGRGDQRVISRYFPQELKDEFETLEKGLKYVNGREDINEVAKACEYARTLFVDRHWTIDTLSIIKNSVENIRFCVLVECNKLKNVINGHDLYLEGDNEDKFNVEKPVFGLLQYLSIHYMKNLKSIWAGPFPSGSLKKLQILALNACPNLDTILDDELLRNLLSLKELIVEDCPKLESLVSVESSKLEFGKEILPSLERITLLYLPKLVSISRGLQIAPRLARMVVYDCPKLQTLSPMEVYCKHINEIKGESEWWKTLQIKSDQLDVFVPLEGDGLMNQLAEARTSHNTLSTIQNSDANQELYKEIAKPAAALKSLEEKLEKKLKLELEHKEPEKELEVKRTQELVIAKMDAATASEKASQIEKMVEENPKDRFRAFDTRSSESALSKAKLEAVTSKKDTSYSKSSANDPKPNLNPPQMEKPEAVLAKASIIESIRETDKLKLKLKKLSGLPDGRFNLDTNSWKRGKSIGSGSLGTVYQGFTENGDLVAVKEVLFLDQGKQGKQSIDQLEREISVLSQLQHENIVQYLGTETDNSKLYIFLEFVHKGSLASLYQKFNLGDSQVSIYTRQILSGLSYLHSQNVAHMDIKCANILVDSNGSVKLADFGLAKASKLIGTYSDSFEGSVYWMAPEVVQNKSDVNGLAADIWSLGCTVLEMLTRQVPYFPLDGIQVLDRIGSGELPDIPDSLSEDALDFILKCLHVNPDYRPSADQLSNHAFVKGPGSSNVSLKKLQKERTIRTMGEGLGERLGIREEVMIKACSMSMKAHKCTEKKHYVYDKVDNSLEVVFAFNGLPLLANWKPFEGAEIEIGDLFPSIRSIGTNQVAMVNKAFLLKFHAVLKQAKFVAEVEKAMDKKKQIVFAGHSSGGGVAILITLWFLETYIKKGSYEKPPHCFTFGSPLVGDRIVSHALRRENWAHYFIHFVTKYDIVPRIMLTPLSTIEDKLGLILPLKKEPVQKSNEVSKLFNIVMNNALHVASHSACVLKECTDPILDHFSRFNPLSPYRPSGTYVFSTGNGRLAVVENPDAVLQMLFYCAQLSKDEDCEEIACKSINEHMMYETELESSIEQMQDVVYFNQLKKIPLSSNGNASHDPMGSNAILADFGLSTQARMCLRAAGGYEEQKLKNEKEIKKDIIEEEVKKIEEYKKWCESQAKTYYDGFKFQDDEKYFKANESRLILAGIWDEIREKIKNFELPDEFEGQKEWIMLGSKYQMLYEPLDIANYYRHLKYKETKSYMSETKSYMSGRPNRYKFIQRWREYDQKMRNDSSSGSCLLAKVEQLKVREVETYESRKQDILKLEKEALDLVNSKKELWKGVFFEEVGEDVFSKGSTFSDWWKGLPEQHRRESCIKHLINN